MGHSWGAGGGLFLDFDSGLVGIFIQGVFTLLYVSDILFRS